MSVPIRLTGRHEVGTSGCTSGVRSYTVLLAFGIVSGLPDNSAVNAWGLTSRFHVLPSSFLSACLNPSLNSTKLKSKRRLGRDVPSSGWERRPGHEQPEGRGALTVVSRASREVCARILESCGAASPRSSRHLDLIWGTPGLFCAEVTFLTEWLSFLDTRSVEWLYSRRLGPYFVFSASSNANPKKRPDGMENICHLPQRWRPSPALFSPARPRGSGGPGLQGVCACE